MTHSAITTSTGLTELPPDTLYGIALRPPVLEWDGLHYQGSVLQHWDVSSVAALPGVIACVQQQHFVGLVASSSTHAHQAAETVRPIWGKPPQPLAQQTISDAASAQTNSYVWHGSPAPSVLDAVVTVWVTSQQVTVWLPLPHAHIQSVLLEELRGLLQQPALTVQFAQHPDCSQATPLPLLSVLDAAAEAALLSRHTQRPVSVHCRRLGNTKLSLHLARNATKSASSGEPSLPDMATTARNSKQAQHEPSTSLHANAQMQWTADSLWVQRPSWARLLSLGMVRQKSSSASLPEAGVLQPQPYCISRCDASTTDFIAAQVFAHESAQCELALQQGLNPIQTRLEQLPSGPGRALAEKVLSQASTNTAFASPPGWMQGQGFATATVCINDENGPVQQVWSAWVTDIAVSPETGEIAVMRVLAGHDARSLQDAQEAITTSTPYVDDTRWLNHAQSLVSESSAFDHWSIATQTDNAGATRTHLPAFASDQSLPIRHGELAVDGVVTLPAAAAIANAIHQATGVRLRQAPFDTEQLRLALTQQAAARSLRSVRKWASWMTAGAASAMGLLYMAWPAKPALPLTSGPDLSIYSPEALERGRLVAAAGDCAVCHTAPGGAANAGGLGLETPFGTIYSTNITPDLETGIGRWSYTAFERAMRQGIHQDGRQLYPAFPYTAFAKLSDTDLQALYGYLMNQPAVKAAVPSTELAFPYSIRSSLAGWNALFHDATPYQPDPAHDAIWNRGAYLVNGAGHCGACHTPRNALGAEKMGLSYLAGGEAEGWQAPALNRLAHGKNAWSSEDLVRYLRTGYSSQHGAAAGPMGPVIHGLAQLPESDVQAIATYLLSLSAPEAMQQKADADTSLAMASVVTTAGSKSTAVEATQVIPTYSAHIDGERIYGNACAVCHEAGQGPTLFGVKPDLGLNTNLHADSPRNLLQTILNGVNAPADDSLGFMPGFAETLDDQQIVDLVHYLRSRFAPDEPAWSLSAENVQAMRNNLHTGH